MHSGRFFRIGGEMKAINSFSFNRQSISIAICLSLAVPLMAVAATPSIQDSGGVECLPSACRNED